MTDDLLLNPGPDGPEGDDASSPPRAPRSRWPIIAIGLAVVVIGVIIVSTQLPRWLTTSDGRPRTSEPAATGGEARRIQATLFYVSENGTMLVGTGRSVVYGATPAEQVRRLVEAQLAAPPQGLVSAIPTGTTVRAVFVTSSNDAYVDLGGTIVTGQTGGSLDEALTVYAIVNAVTVNLPSITGVQILVEGKEVDSLAGHIDLRAPLVKALDWIEKGQ